MPSGFGTEVVLYNWLRKYVHGHWYRIENYVGTGFPDASYAMRATDSRCLRKDLWTEGMTELKISNINHVTDKSIVKLKVRKEQYAWLMARRAYMGNVSITVGCPNGKILIIPPVCFELVMDGFKVSDAGLLITADKEGGELLRACYADLYNPHGPFCRLFSQKALKKLPAKFRALGDGSLH